MHAAAAAATSATHSPAASPSIADGSATPVPPSFSATPSAMVAFHLPRADQEDQSHDDNDSGLDEGIEMQRLDGQDAYHYSYQQRVDDDHDPRLSSLDPPPLADGSQLPHHTTLPWSFPPAQEDGGDAVDPSQLHGAGVFIQPYQPDSHHEHAYAAHLQQLLHQQQQQHPHHPWQFSYPHHQLAPPLLYTHHSSYGDPSLAHVLEDDEFAPSEYDADEEDDTDSYEHDAAIYQEESAPCTERLRLMCTPSLATQQSMWLLAWQLYEFILFIGVLFIIFGNSLRRVALPHPIYQSIFNDIFLFFFAFFCLELIVLLKYHPFYRKEYHLIALDFLAIVSILPFVSILWDPLLNSLPGLRSHQPCTDSSVDFTSQLRNFHLPTSLPGSARNNEFHVHTLSALSLIMLLRTAFAVRILRFLKQRVLLRLLIWIRARRKAHAANVRKKAWIARAKEHVARNKIRRKHEREIAEKQRALEEAATEVVGATARLQARDFSFNDQADADAEQSMTRTLHVDTQPDAAEASIAEPVPTTELAILPLSSPQRVSTDSRSSASHVTTPPSTLQSPRHYLSPSGSPESNSLPFSTASSPSTPDADESSRYASPISNLRLDQSDYRRSPENMQHHAAMLNSLRLRVQPDVPPLVDDEKTYALSHLSSHAMADSPHDELYDTESTSRRKWRATSFAVSRSRSSSPDIIHRPAASPRPGSALGDVPDDEEHSDSDIDSESETSETHSDSDSDGSSEGEYGETEWEDEYARSHMHDPGDKVHTAPIQQTILGSFTSHQLSDFTTTLLICLTLVMVYIYHVLHDSPFDTVAKVGLERICDQWIQMEQALWALDSAVNTTNYFITHNMTVDAAIANATTYALYQAFLNTFLSFDSRTAFYLVTLPVVHLSLQHSFGFSASALHNLNWNALIVPDSPTHLVPFFGPDVAMHQKMRSSAFFVSLVPHIHSFAQLHDLVEADGGSYIIPNATSRSPGYFLFQDAAITRLEDEEMIRWASIIYTTPNPNASQGDLPTAPVGLVYVDISSEAFDTFLYNLLYILFFLLGTSLLLFRYDFHIHKILKPIERMMLFIDRMISDPLGEIRLGDNPHLQEDYFEDSTDDEDTNTSTGDENDSKNWSRDDDTDNKAERRVLFFEGDEATRKRTKAGERIAPTAPTSPANAEDRQNAGDFPITLHTPLSKQVEDARKKLDADPSPRTSLSAAGVISLRRKVHEPSPDSSRRTSDSVNQQQKKSPHTTPVLQDIKGPQDKDIVNTKSTVLVVSASSADATTNGRPPQASNAGLNVRASKFSNETITVEKSLKKLVLLLQVGFGVAGSTIISNHMVAGDRLNPIQKGRKIFAIFGFCDLKPVVQSYFDSRDEAKDNEHRAKDEIVVSMTSDAPRAFSESTHFIEQIMVFINQLQAIVHGETHTYGGFINSSIGSNTLMAWKVDIDKFVRIEQEYGHAWAAAAAAAAASPGVTSPQQPSPQPHLAAYASMDSLHMSPPPPNRHHSTGSMSANASASPTPLFAPQPRGPSAAALARRHSLSILTHPAQPQLVPFPSYSSNGGVPASTPYGLSSHSGAAKPLKKRSSSISNSLYAMATSPPLGPTTPSRMPRRSSHSRLDGLPTGVGSTPPVSVSLSAMASLSVNSMSAIPLSMSMRSLSHGVAAAPAPTDLRAPGTPMDHARRNSLSAATLGVPDRASSPRITAMSPTRNAIVSPLRRSSTLGTSPGPVSLRVHSPPRGAIGSSHPRSPPNGQQQRVFAYPPTHGSPKQTHFVFPPEPVGASSQPSSSPPPFGRSKSLNTTPMPQSQQPAVTQGPLRKVQVSPHHIGLPPPALRNHPNGLSLATSHSLLPPKISSSQSAHNLASLGEAASGSLPRASTTRNSSLYDADESPAQPSRSIPQFPSSRVKLPSVLPLGHGRARSFNFEVHRSAIDTPSTESSKMSTSPQKGAHSGSLRSHRRHSSLPPDLLLDDTSISSTPSLGAISATNTRSQWPNPFAPPQRRASLPSLSYHGPASADPYVMTLSSASSSLDLQVMATSAPSSSNPGMDSQSSGMTMDRLDLLRQASLNSDNSNPAHPPNSHSTSLPSGSNSLGCSQHSTSAPSPNEHSPVSRSRTLVLRPRTNSIPDALIAGNSSAWNGIGGNTGIVHSHKYSQSMMGTVNHENGTALIAPLPQRTNRLPDASSQSSSKEDAPPDDGTVLSDLRRRSISSCSAQNAVSLAQLRGQGLSIGRQSPSLSSSEIQFSEHDDDLTGPQRDLDPTSLDQELAIKAARPRVRVVSSSPLISPLTIQVPQFEPQMTSDGAISWSSLPSNSDEEGRRNAETAAALNVLHSEAVDPRLLPVITTTPRPTRNGVPLSPITPPAYQPSEMPTPSSSIDQLSPTAGRMRVKRPPALFDSQSQLEMLAAAAAAQHPAEHIGFGSMTLVDCEGEVHDLSSPTSPKRVSGGETHGSQTPHLNCAPGTLQVPSDQRRYSGSVSLVQAHGTSSTYGPPSMPSTAHPSFHSSPALRPSSTGPAGVSPMMRYMSASPAFPLSISASQMQLDDLSPDDSMVDDPLSPHNDVTRAFLRMSAHPLGQMELTRMASQALLAFCTTLVKIANDASLDRWRKHALLKPHLTGIGGMVDPDDAAGLCNRGAGMGLHIGWAIEGAIGSSHKIDATYLSPNVNLASRLAAATKQYFVALLFSHQFFLLLPQILRDRCRHVDRVILKGSAKPMSMYTFDIFLEAPSPAPVVMPTASPQPTPSPFMPSSSPMPYMPYMPSASPSALLDVTSPLATSTTLLVSDADPSATPLPPPHTRATSRGQANWNSGDLAELARQAQLQQQQAAHHAHGPSWLSDPFSLAYTASITGGSSGAPLLEANVRASLDQDMAKMNLGRRSSLTGQSAPYGQQSLRRRNSLSMSAANQQQQVEMALLATQQQQAQQQQQLQLHHYLQQLHAQQQMQLEAQQRDLEAVYDVPNADPSVESLPAPTALPAFDLDLLNSRRPSTSAPAPPSLPLSPPGTSLTTDPILQKLLFVLFSLQQHVPHPLFILTHNHATHAYTHGDWPTARQLYEQILQWHRADGPARVVLEYMAGFNFQAPADWCGYRKLEKK